MEELLSWLTQYGDLALYVLLVLGIVGVPFPDEWLLLAAGYSVHRGLLRFAPTILAAAMGAICGITLSYLIGRYLGLLAIHKFGYLLHINEKNLETVRTWFRRWGRWTLVFGFFVPGMRHMTAIVSGASKLPWGGFAPFAYAGACLWSSTFIVVGYVIGPKTPELAKALLGYIRGVSLSVIAVFAIVLLGRLLVMRRRQKPSG